MSNNHLDFLSGYLYYLQSIWVFTPCRMGLSSTSKGLQVTSNLKEFRCVIKIVYYIGIAFFIPILSEGICTCCIMMRKICSTIRKRICIMKTFKHRKLFNRCMWSPMGPRNRGPRGKGHNGCKSTNNSNRIHKKSKIQTNVRLNYSSSWVVYKAPESYFYILWRDK